MTAKNTKKLTILHSNDLHGDFLAEHIDEKLIGGVSLLSGYINDVRKKEKNVVYAIAEICSVVPSLTVNIRDYQQLKS